MTNATPILLVGSVDCNDGVNTILFAMTLGKPGRSAAEYGGPSIDIAAVGSVDTSQLVESRFTVDVSASSVDAVSAIVALIASEVASLANITVGLQGSAYTGTLKVRIGECIEIPLAKPMGSALMNAHWTRIEIVVRREPWVYGPAETLYTDEGFDLPAMIDLSPMGGQAPAPLNLVVAASTLTACYVGHTDDEMAVIGDFVRPLAGASWSAGEAAANATGYPAGAGNTIWRHTAAAYTDVDVTDLPAGQYLVLANCAGTTANVDAIQTPFSDPVLIPTTTLRLLELGVISLPSRIVTGAESDLLRVTITGGGGGEYAAVNYVAFLPVSRGLTGYVQPFSYLATLRWREGTLYANDIVNYAYVRGVAAMPTVLGGQLVILAEGATAAPTLPAELTVDFTPRWEQFPGRSWASITLEELVALGEAERITPADDSGYRRFDDTHGRAFMRAGKNYFTDPRSTGAVTDGIPAGLTRTTDMVTPPTVTRVDGLYGEYAYHVEGTTEIGKTWNLWSMYQGGDFAAEDSVAMSVQIRIAPDGLPAGLDIYTNVFDDAWGMLANHSEVVDGVGRAVNLVSIPAATAPNIVQFGIGSFTSWPSVGPIDFYFECLQVENSPYATPFFHGNEPGCSWADTVDASVSSRAGSVYDFANADLIPTLGEGTVYMQAALEHGSSGGVFGDTFFRFGDSPNGIEFSWWTTDTLLLRANSDVPNIGAAGVPAALTPFAAVACWDRSELRLAIDGVEWSALHALDFDGASAEERFFGGTDNPGSFAAVDGYLRCVVISETKKPLTWRQAISASGGVTNLTTLWREFMSAGNVLIPLDHDGFAYRKVSGPPVTAAPRFLFLGDSLTMGLFSTDLEHSYRYLLEQQFNATSDSIRGISGGGSYDFLTQEVDITAAAPDVLILELGTNDDGHAGSTPWTLAQNLRTLIGWTRAGNPECRVVALGLWGRSENSTRWDAEIERVTNDYGGHFVSLDAMCNVPGNRSVAGQPSPYEGIPDGEGGWLTDAFHPGDAGHAAIAAAVGAVLEKLV